MALAVQVNHAFVETESRQGPTMGNEALSRVLERLDQVRRSGDGYTALCPAHPDRERSLSVAEGDRVPVVLNCFAGCPFALIVDALGLMVRDLMPAPAFGGGVIVRPYAYLDEHGTLLYQNVRKDPKGFFLRRPDSQGGWIYKLDGTRRILYRLDKLHRERPPALFIVEGEADVEQIERLDLSATTSPFGAGKWRRDYTVQLVACGVTRVAIVPDHDIPGHRHAEMVAASCHAAGIVVRIVTIPGLHDGAPLKKHGRDVSDWLREGTASCHSVSN